MTAVAGPGRITQRAGSPDSVKASRTAVSARSRGVRPSRQPTSSAPAESSRTAIQAEWWRAGSSQGASSAVRRRCSSAMRMGASLRRRQPDGDQEFWPVR